MDKATCHYRQYIMDIMDIAFYRLRKTPMYRIYQQALIKKAIVHYRQYSMKMKLYQFRGTWRVNMYKNICRARAREEDFSWKLDSWVYDY